MKKSILLAGLLLLFFTNVVLAQCPTGSSSNRFTSLAQARTVTVAGTYYFNLNGTTFSTYVDANGYVQIAHDYGNGSGSLSQRTSLNNSTRGILNPTVLSRLTDANEVRISHSGGDFDVTTTNATILARLRSNTAFHRGTSFDNVVNSGWSGTESSAITGDGTCTQNSTSLHENIVFICGNSSGLHWAPSTSNQRIRWSTGAHSGEIPSSESFSLWARASADTNCYTYVPDDSFEAYLEANGMGNGISNDNYVTTANISSVTSLVIVGQSGITNFTGIEDFTSLTSFIISGGTHSFTNVDLTNNSNLQSVFINIPSLTSINVGGLSNITSLNVTGTSVDAVDVSAATSMTYIGLSDTNVSSLNLTNNSALQVIYLNNTSNITTLDVSQNSNLVNLFIQNTNLETVDVRNGNNTNLIFRATNSPNLICLPVDDVTYSVSNWASYIDDTSVFQAIGCDETYVPDDNFEAFLEANGMGNGVANDNAVTTSNISSVTGLSLLNTNISDLTGIEDFTALQSIGMLFTNPITTADFSNNTNLTEIIISTNTLTSINVSNLSNLTDLSLNQTGLSSIDLSDLSALRDVGLSNTNISTIDFSNNPQLRNLYMSNSSLSTLDVSANTELRQLDISNTNVSSIDISSNLKLDRLDVANLDNITTLDLTAFTNLNWLDISNMDNLQTVDLRNGNNAILTSEFRATNLPNIQYINVDNAAYSIATWGNVDDSSVFQEHGGETYVPDNNFEAFLEANGMGDGIANNDYVTTANISSVTALDVDNESISDMTGIEDFTALTSLSANGNPFTSIDVSANTALTHLDLRNTSIATVNTSTLTSLEGLYVSGTNTVTGLNLSNNTALRNLQVTSNQLTSLDVSNNTALESMTLRFTSITNLDVSNNTALIYLDIQDMSLPSMDLSNNTALTSLYAARNNALTSLNIKNGNNTNMTVLSIHTNPNLNCILVDDVAYANTNFTNIDSGLVFSNVNCNMTNVPDDNFENYLETHDVNGNVVSVGASNSMGNGIANDNQVFTYRISSVTALNVNYQSIADMTGLADFAALEDLDAIGNSFSSIDVSANTALIHLELRQNGSLTGVDVSNLPLLQSLNVNETNSITSVDVSNNPALVTLQVTSNLVTSVDVSNNPALESLTVEKTSITSLDLSNNPVLRFLDARDLSVSTLDLSNNPALTHVFLQRGAWTSVNLKNGANTTLPNFAIHTSPNLYCVQVDDVAYANTNFTNKDAQVIYSETCGTINVPDDNFENYLETHDANGNVVSIGAATSMGNGVANDNLVFTDKIASVTTLDISSQSITDLTGIEGFAAIESLNVSTNNISTIDVSQLNSLEELYVVNTAITTLDVSSNTALKHLEVSGTNLTTLDLSNNPNMQVLYLVNMPQLLTVDLKNGNGTNMTTIDRSQTGSITCVNVDESALNYFNTTFVAEMIPIANFNAHCFETYVPGDNFENYLETHDANGNVVPLGDPTSMGNGIANDDYVTTANIASVTTLNMQTQSIGNLTGIEGFAALTYFEVRGNNVFASIDLSNNTNLEEAYIGSSPYNTINVSTLTNLRVLDIEDTQLTTLDLSNNTALTTFKLRNSDITNLDFSNNTALTSLDISNSDLTTLNVKNGNNTNVTLFDTTGSTNLTCILVDDEAYSTTNWTSIASGSVFTNVSCGTTDIPNGGFETFLEANGMGNGIANDGKVFTHNIASVTSLDVSGLLISDMTGIEDFIALEDLRAGNNSFTSIDLSSNTALTYLDLRDNVLLSSVDVSVLSSLQTLRLNNSSAISSIDVSNNLALTTLDAISTGLTSLDVRANTALRSLAVRFTNITSLDLSNNVALETLDVQNMSMTTLDLSNNVALTSLQAKAGAFTSMNIKNGNNTNMTTLSIHTNPSLKCVLVDDTAYATTNFTGIDAGLVFNTVSCDMTSIPDDNFEAYLEANSLGNGVANDDLVFTHNIASVIGLDVDNQNISDLTGLEDFTALEALNARNNGLTTIDVSTNTNLSHLFLDNNSLTTINISALTALEEIGLTGNTGITSLSVSSFASLENIEIRNTGITSLDVTSNAQLISLDIRETGITSLDLTQNPNLNTFRANDSSLASLDIRNGQNTNITTFDTTGAASLTCVNVDDANYSTTNWTNIASGTRFAPDCSYIYMPDDNFEMYAETHDDRGRTVLMGDSSSLGNGVMDNYVVPTKTTLVSNLNISGENISDLTGIEGFDFVTNLNVSNNNITTLDLTGINTVSILQASNNPITTIDVSSSFLQILDISDTNLTSINLSNQFGLTNIDADNVPLTALDVSTVTGLTDLNLSNTNLTALDVSANTSLRDLDFSGSSNLATLNLGPNLNLRTLDISQTSVGSLSLAGNLNLDDLDISNTSITSLDLSSNTGLTKFTAQNSALTALNFKNGNNANITTFNTAGSTSLACIEVDNPVYSRTNWTNVDSSTSFSDVGCGTTSIPDANFETFLESNLLGNGIPNDNLVFTGNISVLTSLNISNQNITDLTGIAAFTSLQTLNAESNNLSTVDLSSNTTLTSLNIAGNLSVTTINLSALTALQTLDIANTGISNLDISTNTALTTLDIEGTGISSLSLIPHTSLVSFNAKNAALTSLNVKNGNNSNVTLFDVTGNAGLSCITVDDAGYSVTNWTNIDAGMNFSETTSCATTSITDANFEAFLEANGMGNGIGNDNLVITGNIAGVTSLDISSQNISDLTGIEDFTALEILNVGSNPITSVDFTSNTALRELNLRNTDITALDVSYLTVLENLNAEKTDITTIDLSQNTALTTVNFSEANNIVLLDFSKNTNLTSVSLSFMTSLDAVDLKNGTNTNITAFAATSTSACFKVDDPAYSDANWTAVVNPGEFFKATCDGIDTQVPDNNFENYLETHDANGNVVPVGDASSMGNGIANDDYVLTSRISGVTILNMQNQSIADMTGIEDFTSLQELRLDGNTGINTIDVSANTNLVVLRLYQANISTLDVSALSNLGDLVIASTQITSIDVSNNTSLYALDMRFTNIPTVDLSQNTALTYLNALNANLTSLNVRNGNNTNVTTFELTGNTGLSCVFVDNPSYSFTNWTDVESGVVFATTDCNMTYVPDDNFEAHLEANGMGNGVANDNHVLTANISSVTALSMLGDNISDMTGIEDFTALVTLNINNNNVSSIDVSSLTSLEVLVVANNPMGSIDVSNNTALRQLGISNTNITSLDISANTALENLTMVDVGITSLDLSSFSALSYLNIQDTPISSLDLSNNSALTVLNAINSGLTSLNVKNGNNTNITTFQVTGNPGLSCITVDDAGYSTTNWTSIDAGVGFSESVSCGTTSIPDNNFEAFLEANGMGNGIANDNLVFTGNISAVTTLDLSGQSIANLTGISAFVALENLSLANNSLTSIDVSSNTSLQVLNVSQNAITSIDVSALTALTSLNASQTSLSGLDVSSNTALTVLNAQSAALTSLNVKNGNNSNVTTFDVTGNVDLSCITVDDEGYSITNWINIDAGVNFSQTTSCATTSVPDDNFEAFLEANGMGNGIANDNLVITGNISGVTSLDVENQGIADMTGIEDFTALETLNASYNTFSTIDLSGNTALKSLLLYFNISITSIDVSTLTALETINLTRVPITTIDFSNNTALRIVGLSSTELTTLDLSNNPNVESVNVSDIDNITTVNLKNGNSSNITTFNTSLTSTINCVNVDESALNHFNTTFVDGQGAPNVTFNAHCFETQIPDDNFENYLETHNASGNVVPVGDPNSMGNGIANDDYVTTANITGVTALHMQNQSITDMTGIDAFGSLQDLRLDGNTGLSSINVSSNTSLTILRLSQTNISSLNVSALSNLETLTVASTLMITLNVSNNTALTSLDIEDSSIAFLDLSLHTNLVSLNARNAALTTLNIKNGNNTNITTFNTTGNAGLTCIMVDNPAYSYTNWTDIDAGASFTNTTDCTTTTSIPDNNFEAYLEANNLGNGIANDDLVFTGNISGLTSLDISSQNIANLTGIEAFTSLTTLNVSSNASVSSLDVSALTALENLNISNTGISSLDLTSNTALTVFNGQNAALTSLDIKNGANTSITSFNTTGNASLECIQVDNITYATTNWTNIDSSTSFSGLCGFTYVPDNNFEMYLETHNDRGRSVPMGDAESLGNGVMDDYVDTSKIETLTSLFVSNQNISDLTGIEDFTALRSLWVDENSLTSLDVSNNTNLDDLNCSSNSLTSIDVSDLTSLASLDVSNMNGITTIDLSNNTDLLSLRASNTGLTSLDLRAFTSLNDLDIRNAQLTSLDLRNGNNTNMNNVQFDGNFDLTCISVDDVDYATNNWDPIAGEFSLSCGETYVPDDAFEMYLETHDDRGFSVSMGSPSSLGNGSMDNFVTTSKLEFIFNLDVSGESIADLTGIKDFENLSNLDVSFTNITSLDLSGLQFITHLSLSNTSLTSLNVSSYNNLQVLDISDTSISSINLSSNSSLQEINIGNTPMTSIDLSNNTSLTRFEMFNGALTSLDLSSNTSLTDFNISNSSSLITVDLRNGNNTNMVGFSSNTNANLTCIQVDDAGYSTTNWTNKDGHTSFGESGCGIMLTAKVFLHGAYDSSSSMMRADLGAARLPTDTPHTDGVAANAAIFDTTGNNAIVDWVYVELRDKDDITSVVKGVSAFVQRDGDIVGTDGTSALTIDAASGDYYISVRHRNHIPIATDMTVSLSATVTHIDFTNVNNIRGGASAISDVNGTPVLIPGDVDGNGQVQLSDYFAGLALVGQPGYRTGDINMDGQVQLSDMLNILVSFIGKGVKF